MFDLLKKKITGFIDGFLKKEEKKSEPELEKSLVEKEVSQKEHKIEEAKEHAEEIKSQGAERKSEEKELSEVKTRPEIKEKENAEIKVEKIPAIKPTIAEERKTKVEHKKPELPKFIAVQEEKKREAKVGIFSQIKSIFTGEVEISAQDVEQLLEVLELDLLEADVGLDVANEIKLELERSLVGKKIKKAELNDFIRNAIRSALVHIAKNEKIFDLVERVKQSEKPVKIMFIGPNGSGKTTTISKVAKMLIENDYKVAFAAADTFRAAAIEQMSIHGEKLGVKTIKREYGSDPTAVAYDAVNYAKAHGIDVVLIDTAGRQDTNLNLINELKKMNRVIQPHVRIYVGESIAGSAIIEQVTRFNKEIGIEGIILTKLDCDPKGGTVLSLSKLTGIPIVYVGTGQTYNDLEKFDAEKMVDSILS